MRATVTRVKGAVVGKGKAPAVPPPKRPTKTAQRPTKVAAPKPTPIKVTIEVPALRRLLHNGLVCSSPDMDRPIITGLLLTHVGATRIKCVVTDSYVLVETMADATWEGGPWPADGILVARATAIAFQAALAPKNVTEIELSFDLAKLTATLVIHPTTDGRGNKATAMTLTMGIIAQTGDHYAAMPSKANGYAAKYPNTETIWKLWEPSPGGRIGLDARLLARLNRLQSAGVDVLKGCRPIRFHLGESESKPVKFEVGTDVVGLIMPMKLNDLTNTT